MRTYVRAVPDSDVLQALLDAGVRAPETLQVVRIHTGNWHEWEFDHDELGTITLPIDKDHQSVPVDTDYPRYRALLATPEGSRHADTHLYFMDQLEAKRRVIYPVVQRAAYDRQIHDGLHRVYAGYEFSQSKPGFRLPLFWNVLFDQ